MHGLGETLTHKGCQHLSLRQGVVPPGTRGTAASETRQIRGQAVQPITEHPHQVGPVGRVAPEAMDEQRRRALAGLTHEHVVAADL